MAPKKTAASSSLSPISIGDCEVIVEANRFTHESKNPTHLEISINRSARVRISVRREDNRMAADDPRDRKMMEKGKSSCFDDYVFLLVNPRDADGCSKCYLQEILNLYTQELPNMNYAANTGKRSMFLERCVSNGRYCTLLLKSRSEENPEGMQLIAAITYQIVPADTQHAEIPLAAVSASYQHQGFGHFLYMELRKRLQSVGVQMIYCWGDSESEGFWLKQGFISIAEVGRKGRTRRLPIRADIRKSLCFPGGSTLMVSHLNKDSSSNLMDPSKFSLPMKSFCPSTGAVNSIEAEAKQPSPSAQGIKRSWEASLSSLKSKKVQGIHQIVSHSENAKSNTCFYSCSMGISRSSAAPADPLTYNCAENNAREDRSVVVTSTAVACEEQPDGNFFRRIMLMNVADDSKKSHLTKVIESLGGEATTDGIVSTHVVTGKVRKTLNFCTALCSGAWIVSSSWLKESYRKGKFVDEMSHILHDEEYMLTYKTELKVAVLRAKARPRGLLNGYHICIASHVQPPLHTLSAIIKSAGGNIIPGLDESSEATKTIFIACKEDAEEALLASKKGVWTFNSDWLMNCIMRQELDFESQQIAVSL